MHAQNDALSRDSRGKFDVFRRSVLIEMFSLASILNS
jgi:hypothetical protein